MLGFRTTKEKKRNQCKVSQVSVCSSLTAGFVINPLILALKYRTVIDKNNFKIWQNVALQNISIKIL